MRRAAELSSTTDRWGGVAFYSLLLQLSRRAEAQAEYQRWSSTSGNDWLALMMREYFLIRTGGFERAVKGAEITVRLRPQSAGAHAYYADALEMVGDYEGAARARAKLLSLVGAPADAERIEKGWLDGGRDGYLRGRGQSQANVSMWFAAAGACALRGDKDAAFAHLETAYAKRDPTLRQPTMDRWLRPLHSDPRFADLARRMNLPLPKP
jgi:tetratricopeptide (TPR) repeat protein